MTNWNNWIHCNMVQWTSTLLFSAPDIFISGQPTVIHQQPPPARSQASPAPSNLDPTAASTAINWLDYGMKIPCVIYIYFYCIHAAITSQYYIFQEKQNSQIIRRPNFYRIWKVSLAEATHTTVYIQADLRIIYNHQTKQCKYNANTYATAP